MPTLEMTTMIGCPLMCSFCPQPGLKSAYEKRGNDRRDREAKYMSFDNFALMLAKAPKHVRIDFSGMAEPWANPECTRMLRHALDGGYKVAVFSTLYGMSETDADEVVELLRARNDQVEVVCLHLPDANGNMPGWKPSAEWENVFLKFRNLMQENILERFDLMTMDGSGATHPALDHLGLDLHGWKGHTRAGSLDEGQIEGQHICSETPRHETAIGCAATPFYDHNVVLFQTATCSSAAWITA